MGRLSNLEKVKNQSYTLTEEEYQQCYDFAKSSLDNHLSNERDDKKKFNDILTGKIGEVGFYHLAKTEFRGISKPNFINRKFGDGNNDFKLKENLYTDVKTSTTWKVYFKPVLGYDIISYVIVKERKVTYIGSITRGEAIEKSSRKPGSMGNMGFYVSKKLFEDSIC